jgi:hypothetical protein
MDLAGDGQCDLVVIDGPIPGLYEHDGAEGWQPFRPFTSRLDLDTQSQSGRAGRDVRSLSRNRFVVQYTYHHGYFDGEERQFRGFGMVEQRDARKSTRWRVTRACRTPSTSTSRPRCPLVHTNRCYHTALYGRVNQRGRLYG